jgi:hypothetical protein
MTFIRDEPFTMRVIFVYRSVRDTHVQLGNQKNKLPTFQRLA